jgi:uncharacterized protein YggE
VKVLKATNQQLEVQRMKSLLTLCLALAGLRCWTSTGLLGAEEKRLSVTGTARLDVRPDMMEVFATVSGSAELNKDALKKFRTNRRRGVEAIQKLKIDGLEIKGTGVSVISNAAVQQFQQRFNGMQQATTSHTTFSETLSLNVPGIDHLTDEQVQDLASKILDAAKDAGMSLGQPNDSNPYYYNYNSYKPQIVFFRLAHADSVRQKALDQAAKDARTKAEQMAKRLNLTLGKAVAVRDSYSRQFNNARQNVVVANVDNSQNELSPTLHNITAEATVQIEYEILN